MATELKDHTYDFPKEKIGEKTRRKARVTLEDNGYFKITYPKEVGVMFNIDDKHLYAYGTTLNDAERMFDRQMTDYKNAIQTQKRKKVILVQFLFNSPGGSPLESHRSLKRDDHGHWSDPAGRFALSLDYKVLWQIGESLFDVPIDDRNGRVYGEPHHVKRLPIQDRAYNVLDWTEEREAFLSNMVMSLEGLTGRMRHFFGKNLLENMTKAIATGGGLTALPAPGADA